jgi:putative redox protein
MASVTVMVEQISGTASRGKARGFGIVMDRPEAKGGTNEGMMGGEALLNSLGGCFMSNLLAAAKARNVELRNAVAEIEGDIVDSPSRFSVIRMSVSAQCKPPEELVKLVTVAERGCIVANTLKAAVELSIQVHS